MRWRKTKTARELLPDELQRGPVVAFRQLPKEKPTRLDDIVGPEGPERVVTIGASPHNDITIVHESVSWVHCVLYRDGEVVRVVDGAPLEGRKSYNGTWIDGTRVRGNPTEIYAGQILRIGRAKLLACNDKLEQCPANVIATHLDGFCREAVDVYGTVPRAGRAIGIAVRTLYRRLARPRSERPR